MLQVVPVRGRSDPARPGRSAGVLLLIGSQGNSVKYRSSKPDIFFRTCCSFPEETEQDGSRSGFRAGVPDPAGGRPADLVGRGRLPVILFRRSDVKERPSERLKVEPDGKICLSDGQKRSDAEIQKQLHNMRHYSQVYTKIFEK